MPQPAKDSLQEDIERQRRGAVLSQVILFCFGAGGSGSSTLDIIKSVPGEAMTLGNQVAVAALGAVAVACTAIAAKSWKHYYNMREQK